MYFITKLIKTTYKKLIIIIETPSYSINFNPLSTLHLRKMLEETDESLKFDIDFLKTQNEESAHQLQTWKKKIK